ncbi:MAG: DUF2946 domain-containing protein [Gallionella sp.]|nr:DUF2946 domain-containing protein [Gallionella sp.]NCP80320.1 DUF2946 domain-containing protein [Gallionella sp.]
MSRSARKLIALFMLLWLPLSGGNAPAASLAMQLPNGSCHEAAAMSHQATGEHPAAHDNHAAQDMPSTPCAACGICHLACSGFILPQFKLAVLVAPSALIVTFTPEIFISHVSAPLVPPPLARV